MPEKKTVRRARKDKQEGKAPSTQAGEFVHEEIEHVREGKHGARSAKQAIAIGLSKARKAGVDVPDRSASARKSAARKSSRKKPAAKKSSETARTRSRAAAGALKKEGRSAASKTALSRQGHQAAAKRGATDRSAAAKKGARTKGAAGRSAAAKKAARTRASRAS